MDLQTFLIKFVVFLNSAFIPFLLAFAFIMFLWNMTKYFIIEGANEKEHEKAKSFALYSIAAFVVITSIWGIVNLFTGGFGFTSNQQITPDYMKNGGIGSSGGGGSWNLPWSGNNSGSGSGGNSSSGSGGWSSFWIPTSLIGNDTGNETNINTTGSEVNGNGYYYMNNNTNSETDSGGNTGCNYDAVYANGCPCGICPDDGEGISNSSANSETNINTTGSEVNGNGYSYMDNTNSETNNAYDNYGYVDGSDTNISPDP